jgi:hypothetical protein
MTLVDNQKLLLEKRKSIRRKHRQNSINANKTNGGLQIAPFNKAENESFVKSHSQAMRIYHDAHSDEASNDAEQLAASLSAKEKLELDSKINELNELNRRELTKNDLINTNYPLTNEEAKNSNRTGLSRKFSEHKSDKMPIIQNQNQAQNFKRVERVEPTRAMQKENFDLEENKQKKLDKKEPINNYDDFDKSKVNYLEARNEKVPSNDRERNFKEEEAHFNDIDSANDIQENKNNRKSEFRKSKNKKKNKNKQENLNVLEQKKENNPIMNDQFHDDKTRDHEHYSNKNERKMATDWNSNSQIQNERFDMANEERYQKYGNAISTISKSINRYRFK